MANELPFVDELDVLLKASPEQVYLAVASHIERSLQGLGPRVFSRILGCESRGASFSVPPAVGQTTNGFTVARAEPPGLLVLEGTHRFAIARLSFIVEKKADGFTRLAARTDAAFPGFKGAVYRALVIGSDAHMLIVKGMLASIRRLAERDVGRTVTRE